ncbi:MAG: hypothetical protein BEU00_00590 [Marine Group III euryarchaeote CG-Epi3]|uniref:Methyltransferase domain-containing protein n=1 Tax=Marine Group III euryarchaeote CG-Epi3 TaxID=1888997 RepID=A0A1J5TR17_9ARCH|nr:MAG: hypothetical protein BEU00_00590 [Marine Group III euryarchaeote CG-Epi3]|tara:strand:+ start:2115 stop:2765 length:651 start_codon:yes stop_codon:yes gene_type:complete
MFNALKNFFHIKIVMNLYSLRNYFSEEPGAVWLNLNSSDLENMVSKVVKHKGLDLDGKNILDLGCGTGTMLKYAVDNYNSNAYGVDLIRLNIRQAKKHVPSGNFYRGDIIDYLDKVDSKFDLVILYGVIGCFNLKQQKAIIEKILKYLNPGGMLWIGANLYNIFDYKFQTYPVPVDFYEDYKSRNSIVFDEVIEEELFGKHKYEPKQTSVMITYQP